MLPQLMIRLAALFGVLTISFAAILFRVAGVSPNTAAVFRGAYALPVLFALWLATRRGGEDVRPPRLRWMAGGAGLGLALYLTLWHRTIEDIGAGLATVLAHTQVVFVALIAWAVYRERPTRLAALCIPLVLGGVVLISGVGSAAAYGAHPVRGVLLGTVAGLVFSGYILVFRASTRAEIHPAGPLFDATLGMTLGALAFGAFDPHLDLVPHWPAHGWLVLLALGPQVVGWLLVALAMPRLAALETSVLLLAQPLGAMLFGWLLLGETLGPAQAAGAALVLAGILTLQLGPSVRRAPATDAA